MLEITRSLSRNMLELLVEHIEKPCVPFVAMGGGTRNQTLGSLRMRGLVRIGSSSPTSTVITSRGRDMLGLALADFATLIERAELACQPIRSYKPKGEGIQKTEAGGSGGCGAETVAGGLGGAAVG